MASSSSSAPLVVTFVTGNENKLKEVRAILGADDGGGGGGAGATGASDVASTFALRSQKVDLPELQGEPEDIAAEKAKLAARAVGGPTLVEDTSLCYVALKGLPGPYVKWSLDKLGHEARRALVPVRRRSRRDDRRSSRTLHPGALSVALCRPMKPPRHQTKSKY